MLIFKTTNIDSVELIENGGLTFDKFIKIEHFDMSNFDGYNFWDKINEIQFWKPIDIYNWLIMYFVKCIEKIFKTYPKQFAIYFNKIMLDSILKQEELLYLSKNTGNIDDDLDDLDDKEFTRVLNKKEGKEEEEYLDDVDFAETNEDNIIYQD